VESELFSNYEGLIIRLLLQFIFLLVFSFGKINRVKQKKEKLWFCLTLIMNTAELRDILILYESISIISRRFQDTLLTLNFISDIPLRSYRLYNLARMWSARVASAFLHTSSRTLGDVVKIFAVDNDRNKDSI